MSGEVKPMEGAERPVPGAPKPAETAASRLRREMPSLRTAFLWTEILGRPLSQRRRR